MEYKKNKVEYGTYSKIKYAIEKIIIPNTYNKILSMINENDCRNFSNYLYSLDYSTTHKNYLLRIYKAIFDHSKIFFKNNNNPSYVCMRFKKTYSELVSRNDREQNIWTLEEFNKFIDCMDNIIYKNFFIILYNTGLRLGEAQALKWSDFSNGILNVSKSITRKTTSGNYEIKQTKTLSSIRKVTLGKNLSQYLEKYKEKEKEFFGFNEDWFIFGRKNVLPLSSISNNKKKAIKLSGVKEIRIHDLRHSHASNLIASGVNIVAVSKRLGHSDINMTLKVYSHLMKKSEDELLLILDKTCQKLVNK